MNVGLLSDTHSHFDDRLAHHLKDVDVILHAGDLGDASLISKLNGLANTIGVYGNIDGTEVRSQWPEHALIEINGFTALMIHIAGSIGKYNAKTRALIHQHRPQALICGHSHILKVRYDDAFDLLHINPGAAGRHGFHKTRTLLKFRLTEGKIADLKVVELGPRSAKAID